MFIPGVWILLPTTLGYSQLLSPLFCATKLKGWKLANHKSSIKWQWICLQVWTATHFTPSYWDYWAQVDTKLYCVFTRSDRLWYFGQSPPLDDWQVWHEPAWLLSELLFRSPFCFPTTLCILTVCLRFLLRTLRSVRGAKGLGPIKCGSRWQPGGMTGRRYEISSILEDLLALHWDHTYKTGAAAPYVSKKVTLSEFYLATEESLLGFFLIPQVSKPSVGLWVAYVEGARSIIRIDETYSWIYV